ncbi:hypothetical protein VLK81_00280 [Citroniella saccharovorans]|uniref:Uncharacterized protein n=1 Tax=Citroniella saccharovorans TaxID=2053367 RepID=A0AAW9MRC5_9FIRM|nr:hypothetical protein [Citroniella saccharovorans]MEB3428493.1 hypothetical protein [Citroniella saccharovorans]
MKKLSRILLLSLLLALSFSTNAKVLADDEASEVVLRAPVYEYYPHKEVFYSYQGYKIWRSIERGGHLYQGYIKLTKFKNDIINKNTIYIYEGTLKLVR